MTRNTTSRPKSVFAERIKARLVSLGISQKDVATQAGVSAPLISHLLTGRVLSVDASIVFVLADALKCDARWLVTGEGTAEKKEA